MIFFFYHISELMLATLIQRYDKNHFTYYPVQERGCQEPHFMIVLIPYIYLLKPSWTILFLRNMEPLRNGACKGYS